MNLNGYIFYQNMISDVFANQMKTSDEFISQGPFKLNKRKEKCLECRLEIKTAGLQF